MNWLITVGCGFIGRALINRLLDEGTMLPLDAQINRVIRSVTAELEHLFGVLKHQFGHAATRSRGLAKNRTQLFMLSNLFVMRRTLIT